MTLNPISFTEFVVSDFLRYQLTTYPFADERLYRQMRTLLSLEETRRTPLLKGPYISLSRGFRSGARVQDLAGEGLLHPFMPSLVAFPTLYGHQEKAIRAIAAGRATLVSTGTGSGKTECFLYPVISHCLSLRDQGAPPGIVAVFVYPMNALAEDQLGRMRDLLAGTGIPFGMYVGKTPERAADVAGERLRPGTSRADYRVAFDRAGREHRGTAVHPAEERPSREEMRASGKQPRILLTNVKQLELLLTRHRDVDLFAGSDLRFLVFDEAHTWRGAAGAEAACLIRRLRAFCGRTASETVCVGTSATLVDPGGNPGPARVFASRFFGVAEDGVELVTEEYKPDLWKAERRVPPAPTDPAAALARILDALGEGSADVAALIDAYRGLAGEPLPSEGWTEALYESLTGNEICYALGETLTKPQGLLELTNQLSQRVGRSVTECEILAWLAFGAASRQDGRPLLRPVVHAFVRGVGGAVVTFPIDEESPRLWLSAEQQIDQEGEAEAVRLSVTTCNTCGQHYFVHWVKDLEVTPHGLGGGEAVEDRVVWPPLDESQGGCRVVLFDRLVSTPEEDEEAPAKSQEVYLCRACGALHPAGRSRCDACGRESPPVRLFAVESREDHQGYLTSCFSCSAPGRARGAQYREPARPVRAVPVSDVHVLAQNMVHRADRQRLLVFADNRQEAAFQAGWMQDHARRFRIRSLMAEAIGDQGISIGDLTAFLDSRLAADDSLSRAIAPEVWNVARREQAGGEHARQRKYFLRIQVLREVVTGVKQRVGLEPWGRLKVGYLGLVPDHPVIQAWAQRLALEPARLTDGIAGLLDIQRRGFHLLDKAGKLFSKFWMEGDFEVQYGFIPMLRGVPKGLKLQRAPSDDRNRLTQWLSERGETLPQQVAKKFGVDPDQVSSFLTEVWNALVELGLMAPITLIGARNHALPNCAGAHQIDADRVTLHPNRGRWRCHTCRRTQVRPTPLDRCLAWRCDGTLFFEEDDPDDYNIVALDQNFVMLRPAEHSAQVPAVDRERLERQFKGEGDAVNTLVCTPTLELGVDIGGLDTVLMRNVPPLPSNYWQRVGRAGRRHRLAVNLTYARPTSHDHAYFQEPLKLLAGRVEPPSFNLRNPLMLDRHVRATVITRLHQLAGEWGGLGEFDRTEINQALATCFPPTVKGYLFDQDGRVLRQLYDVGSLTTVVTKHESDLVGNVLATFAATWPATDAELVDEDRLRGAVRATADELRRVLETLKRRLDWCLGQMERLDQIRRERGTLDPDEDALHKRCDDLVKRLKGSVSRRRREAEGYDETSTFGVLAAEGFLPGYGLEVGAVIGTALMPRGMAMGSDFELPRPLGAAIREYVPGNLIYANGHRFVTRYFHLDTEGVVNPVMFQYDHARTAVEEAGASGGNGLAVLGAAALPAVPICDVDLPHFSQISDDEEYRFQLQSVTVGYELGRHGPGTSFQWAQRTLTTRRGVHFRVVNVGATKLVAGGELGYPVCLVSGQSRSPFASQRELEEFSNRQLQRYGRPVENVGFYADIVADALTLPGCASREEAYSVAEALRLGMRQVLEMEREDVQILAIGRIGAAEVDAVLYDPMPGGSGLLDQALARWPEVVQASLALAGGCSSACARSCIDCLQSFRNAYYHRYLDRHLAAEVLTNAGQVLEVTHDIVPRLPMPASAEGGIPSNRAEATLRGMLERAGFPAGEWHRQIHLGAPLGSTSPDVYYAASDPRDPNLCVYLDGLSDGIHGTPETTARDRRIRETLRSRGYEVFEIAATELADRDAMARHFYRLANALLGREEARRVRGHDEEWFGQQ